MEQPCFDATRTFATILVAATVMWTVGGCIEAAPFQASDAASETSTGTPDATADGGDSEDSSGPVDATDSDAPEPDQTAGDADSTENDTPDVEACTGVECACSELTPCDDGLVCQNEVCCAPQCDDKNCGDDSCGGTCGTCGAHAWCDAQQICQALVCVPGTSYCQEGTEIAHTCNEEGTGPNELPGLSTNCASSGKFCVEGKCEDCVPDCADSECGDDGCGGECGQCEGDMVCDNGACTDSECEGDEPVCLVEAPFQVFLCDGGLLPSPESEPIHECSAVGLACHIQTQLGDLTEAIEASGSFDALYCSCTEADQQCIAGTTFLAYCLQEQWVPTDCGDIEESKPFCDVDSDTCVADVGEVEPEGDADCCVGICGLIDECGGVCECPSDYKCDTTGGKCFAPCETGELGHSTCLNEKVKEECVWATMDGANSTFWLPVYCNVEMSNNEATCNEPAAEDAECTVEGSGPSELVECCKSSLNGSCGWNQGCGGNCGCSTAEGYADGFSCTNGECISPCAPGENGDAHCLSGTVMELCIGKFDSQYWVVMDCVAELQDASASCVDDFGSAYCEEGMQPSDDDQLALALNPDPASAAISYGRVADHDDFTIGLASGDAALTLSLWLHGTDMADSQGQTLVRKGGVAAPGAKSTNTGLDEWILFAYNGRVYFQLYSAAGHAWWIRSTPIASVVNAGWAHLVATYSKSGSADLPHLNTRIYLDGFDVTDGQAGSTGKSPGAPNFFADAPNTQSKVMVGRDSSNANWFHGVIDDLAILKVYTPPGMLVLMSTDNGKCAADLTGTGAAGDLIGYWRFEDLYDDLFSTASSVNNHTMQLFNADSPWDSPCTMASME